MSEPQASNDISETMPFMKDESGSYQQVPQEDVEINGTPEVATMRRRHSLCAALCRVSGITKASVAVVGVSVLLLAFYVISSSSVKDPAPSKITGKPGLGPQAAVASQGSQGKLVDEAENEDEDEEEEREDGGHVVVDDNEDEDEEEENSDERDEYEYDEDEEEYEDEEGDKGGVRDDQVWEEIIREEDEDDNEKYDDGDDEEEEYDEEENEDSADVDNIDIDAENADNDDKYADNDIPDEDDPKSEELGEVGDEETDAENNIADSADIDNETDSEEKENYINGRDSDKDRNATDATGYLPNNILPIPPSSDHDSATNEIHPPYSQSLPDRDAPEENDQDYTAGVGTRTRAGVGAGLGAEGAGVGAGLGAEETGTAAVEQTATGQTLANGIQVNPDLPKIHVVKIKQALQNINSHFTGSKSNDPTAREEVLQDLAWLHRFLSGMVGPQGRGAPGEGAPGGVPVGENQTRAPGLSEVEGVAQGVGADGGSDLGGAPGLRKDEGGAQGLVPEQGVRSEQEQPQQVVPVNPDFAPAVDEAVDQPVNQKPVDIQEPQPVIQPGYQPAIQPVIQPVIQPGNQPVNQPGIQPDIQPVIQPGIQPDIQPGIQAGNQPNDQPGSQQINQNVREQAGQPGYQPNNQPGDESVIQPIYAQADQPLSQSNDIDLDQPVYQPVNQPADQPLNQLPDQTTNQSAGQPLHQPADQPLNQPEDQPVNQDNQPIDAGSNQSINQVNQPINQAINQSTNEDINEAANTDQNPAENAAAENVVEESPEATIDDASRPQKPPHIVVIMASDLGWRDVGFHGSEIQTPNLDSLAREGVRLDNHYVQDSSSGTRSQLLTGKYQIHTTLQHGPIKPNIPTGLPVNVPTLGERLRARGYYTSLVGKWHLGMCEREYLPNSRGFDYFFGFLGGSEGHYSHDYCGPEFDGACGHDLWENERPIMDNQTYSTHMYTRRAQDVIQAAAVSGGERPMFLMLSYQAAAAPLEVPEQYLKPYATQPSRTRRTLAGMVSCLDEGVGNITQTLKEAGMWDNTILLFLTDNGGSVFHGSQNSPYRGGKGELWEGGLRGVTLLAGGLMTQYGGHVSGAFVHVSDWFPTLLWLAGAEREEDATLDGFNIWPVLSRGAPSPRIELLHNIDPLHPRSGEVQALHREIFDTSIRAAYRYGDWKILTGSPYAAASAPTNPSQNVWLYNIKEDPEELINLAYNNPQKVAALLMKLAEYLKGSSVVWYPEADPRAHPRMNGGLLGPWKAQ